jgi:hypothetical protein
MNKPELEKARNVNLNDTLAAYAKSISPKSSISEGIRIALIAYRGHKAQKKDAAPTLPKDYAE